MYPTQHCRPTPKKLHFQEDENAGPLAERSNRPERTSFKEIQGNRARGTPHPKARSEAAVAHLDSDVSVSKLKGWLSDFGKSHDHPASKPPTTGVARTTKLAVPVSKRQDVVIGKGPSMTPVRFKTKFENVQATDDGYASVKKLASWLADDPTKKKEVVGHVRKGINVISKSRKFEKELEDVILDEDDDEEEEPGVSTHTVSVGAQRAFGVDEESTVSVADKKKWLQSAFPKKSEEDAQDDGETSTIVSVTDKKKWLANAFVNKKGSSQANSCPPSVMSIKASAKDKWRQKRLSLNEVQPITAVAFATKVTSTEPAIKMARVDGAPEETGEQEFELLEGGVEDAVVKETKVEETKVAPLPAPQWRRSLAAAPAPPPRAVKYVGARPNPTVVAPRPSIVPCVPVPAPRAVKYVGARPNPSVVAPRPSVAPSPPDEEEAPEGSLGFQAARQLLVQRGEKNGNPVMLSKVQVRKAKFEKWEHDLKKGTGAHGLLKPTWEQATPSKGRPSDSYKKGFVSDIAPKKSFQDLP
jgi:hypothetical protein